MEKALALAREALELDEVPVGAIVVHENRIVGRGFNRREGDHDPVAHAEMIAIREAAKNLGSWRLVDCVLIVTLEPCPMCLAAAQQARVESVVYGTEDPKGGALSLSYCLNEDLRLNHRFDAKLLKTSECEKILKDFFKSKRKRD